MTNQELVAISLLQGEHLGIQIKKYYQTMEYSNAAQLREMKIYVQSKMQAKATDETFLPVLEQMNQMIEVKLK